jgi:hypothetical protein
MKKLTALFMSALICLNISSCARSNGTNNTQVTSSAEVNAASGSASQPAADVASADIPDSRKNLRSGDLPVDTVAVIFYPTQPDIGNAYIPDAQDAWKTAITNATKHMQDKKYDVFPFADMRPIYFIWQHDGMNESWTLGNDGSLWGGQNTADSELFKNNYIAPEDAAEVAKLLMQAYDYLEISPVDPGQFKDIVRAELYIKGKTFVLENADGVKKLEDTLRNCKRHTGSGCPFELLRLYKKEGKPVDIAIATDGCAIWHSDGVYYEYDKKEVEGLFKLFGVDLSKVYTE